MKQNNILKWSLILSIIIIANLFFNYSLSLVLNNPDHEEYCPFEKTSQVFENKQSCEEADGIWSSEKIYAPTEPQMVERGYCDLYSKCNKVYEDANKVYEQKVFIALVVIGLVVLISSFFIKTSVVLSSALALTSVLNFIIASMRYWRYSDEVLKVSILFIALSTLIYLTIKKFKDSI